MKLLIFDIIGKFAHFRKYYSNSSALSFGAPPRTTICGMVAAILGMEKDSYYSIMNLEKCKIAVFADHSRWVRPLVRFLCMPDQV